MRWPVGVALSLFVVVALQIAFAVVASQHADVVDPTYASEKR